MALGGRGQVVEVTFNAPKEAGSSFFPYGLNLFQSIPSLRTL